MIVSNITTTKKTNASFGDVKYDNTLWIGFKLAKRAPMAWNGRFKYLFLQKHKQAM